MLSRVADALYWMSRYVERAEHAARVVEVARGFMIDLGEVDPESAEIHWSGTLSALGIHSPEARPASVAFDTNEPGSVLACVSRARENARQVREVTSSEMWEHLNQAYWALREDAENSDREQALSAALAKVVTHAFLWSGVTDATMRRGEGWLFIKLGQFVERADRLSRLIGVRATALEERRSRGASASGENILWLTLLRSVSALEAFRKVHPTRMDPAQVVSFLVLDREFPRTLRYSTAVAADFTRRLTGATGEHGRRVERAFGRLSARLDYTDVDEVLETGVGSFLEGVLTDLAGASLTLQRTYFLH